MSVNTFSGFQRQHEAAWSQFFDTSPALPSWLTATAPAGTTHTAAGMQSGFGYYQMLMQAAAAVSTEGKIETSNGMPSSAMRIRFEVAGWRFDSNTTTDNDFKIYIAGASAGFTLAHTVAAGKTVAQFVGGSAVDSGWVELVTNSNGGRAKAIGLELFPSEKTCNVLVDGGVAATFSTGTAFAAGNDLRAGISITKRAGSTDRWMRYEALKLRVDL